VVSVPGIDLNLEGEQSTEFFRIFQECLTNVMRHAEARSVSVTLREDDGELVLVVTDDGKGFLESEVSDSLGFLGMKERAQVCGGSLDIASSPGSGTTVALRVPLHLASIGKSNYAHSDH
jgi:signal transduction histidine kinase